MTFPIGPTINAAAIIAGSLIGLMLHSRFPDRIRLIVFQGLGLCVLLIGMQMAFKVQNILIMIFAIMIGGILGELLRLEEYFDSLGGRLKNLIRSKNERFTEGFVTATLLFCIGALAIIGSFDEGLRGDRTLVLTKSILDGFASIVLAASYGVGVLFSCLAVLLYQGTLTMGAKALSPWFSELLIAQLTGTGGVLIIGIGISLLDIKRIRLASLLPSLVVVVVLTLAYEAYLGV
ncbi:MAG: DUF554 domain-containing protein [Desulfovibrionaceae bacterium]|jgi:uncharacterized membrane protein YqgA involved in biofilm formation